VDQQHSTVPSPTIIIMLSISFLATMLMAVYVGVTMYSLYQVMFPLTGVDLSEYSYHDDFVHPLWHDAAAVGASTKKKANLHMRVVLSTKPRFALMSLNANSTDAKNNVVLWDERLDRASLAKSFLLTKRPASSSSSSSSDKVLLDDASHRYATQWLDRRDHLDLAELSGESVLSALSAASGQGIESTSFLLLLYESIAKQVRSVLELLSLVEPRMELSNAREALGIRHRETIPLPSDSPIWSALSANQTVYLHVLVLRGVDEWPPSAPNLTEASVVMAANRAHALLIGTVNLLKYEPPHHITRPRRILYHDLVYIVRRYLLFGLFFGNGEITAAPWDMAATKAQAYGDYEMALRMKQERQGYPYWKPQVSIKFVSDSESYPGNHAYKSGMPMQKVGRSKQHPTGHVFLPALHVDEMSMTSDMYIPINETVTAFPLRISFDRNDIETGRRLSSTASAGAMSPARWRLLQQMATGLEQQKALGFEQSDIDDVKRLIADTNVTLLTITLLACALHMLFEFLTFRNEVSFWRQNKDLTGLSVRSLFLDMICQTILLLYLIESESSLLMTVPSSFGCAVALWKCQRATGLQLVRVRSSSSPPTIAWWNWLPRLFGYELRAIRLEIRSQQETVDDDEPAQSRDRLIAMTIQADRIATRYLGVVLLPLTVGYAIYSLVYLEHQGWHSWLITSLASAVYALGFVMMTPQLFLNWKLKSVAHLPWRVLGYKFVNTFIDDLFSFIIRMPAMARISCFRDDIIFFIYLYQRWLYPVDTSRPTEGGDGSSIAATKKGDVDSSATTSNNSESMAISSTKKDSKKKKKKD
jgi:Cleft lip and palate transmembrane protein 1 (CLPTM1)